MLAKGHAKLQGPESALSIMRYCSAEYCLASIQSASHLIPQKADPSDTHCPPALATNRASSSDPVQGCAWLYLATHELTLIGGKE